ncbi:MAG: hypothetical protein D6824_02000 [Planctomycetota bacterium]|nr:MAG: hypothetical protein D6824_02000 [Planctomycetota bacterium]
MAEDAQSQEQTPKKKSLKPLLIVAALLVGEGVGVMVFMKALGKPNPVQGQEIVDDGLAELERIHEVLVVSDRFPNNYTGRTWLWEAEIQAQVKEKNLDDVKRVLEERNAEIKTGISRIFRAAHHNYFTEANLETLTRQVTEYLREVFGKDASGEERIVRVLIPKCVGFPADY